MTFLMTSLLFGGFLAAVPIIVHLMHRSKTTPIAWGAMQFLLDTPVKMRRKKWIDHWLLLLVRIAMLVILALLLARPLLHSSTAKSSVPVDVAVIIDHSLSTGRRAGNAAGGGTLFHDSLAVIEKVRDLLPAQGSISVVLAEHRPRVMTPLPIHAAADIDRLVQTLRQMKPGLTDASIPEAVQAARDTINKGRNPQKLILIVSDDQRSNWSIDNLAAWHAALGDRTNGADKDIPVYAISLPTAPAAANISVGNLALQPSTIGINRPAQISATLSNTSTADIPNVPVSLTVDGKSVAMQSIPVLAAGQSQTLSFTYTFTTPGSHWIRIRTDVVDALEADNAVVAAIHVIPQLPVLIIDGQLTSTGSFRAAGFLQAALQPVDSSAEASTLIQPKVISVADAPAARLADYPVVILNDVPALGPDLLACLTDHALQGNGVWIILGPRTTPAFLNELGKTPLLPAIPKAHITSEDKPATIDIKSPENAMVALLTQAEKNSFAGVTVSQWWQLDSLAGDQNVVLTLTANSSAAPFVVEHHVGTSGGRVVLWTSSADGTGSTLPLAANFVPLVTETAFYLASSQTQAQAFQLTAGQPIAWTSPPNVIVKSVRVLPPNGIEQTNLPVRLTNDRYTFTYDDTFVPGLYELHFDPPTIPQPIFCSVNIDRRELEPATLSAADIEALKEPHLLTGRLAPDALADAFQIQLTGTEVWPYAALALLAFLVLETFLTCRAIGLQRGTDARDLITPGEVASS